MIKSLSLISVCILASLLIVMSGCQREEPVPVEPVKPANIPAASIWVGGIDGGVFVTVKELEETNTGKYYAEIYYVSGDLAYKGIMKINPPGSIFDPKKKESYEGWDGDNLYLSNNGYLQVIE